MKRSLPALKNAFCFECGEPFQYRLEGAKYCSPACRVRHCRRMKKQNERLVTPKPKKVEPVEVVLCAWCNAGMWLHRNSPGLYCSNACKQAAYRDRCKRGIDAYGRPRKGVQTPDLNAPPIYAELYQIAFGGD